MSEESREHLRIRMDSQVFIELASPEVDSSEESEIARCKTYDISREGLQVGLACELQEGAILQIGVNLPGAEETFYLAGEVRWCRPNSDPETGWSAGFKLMNATDSDIESWRELMHHV